MTENGMRSSSRAGYAFAAVDARSRLAYVEVREDERKKKSE